MEGHQIYQAWLALSEAMLAVTNHPLFVHVPKHSFWEDLLHDLAGHWVEIDWSVVSCRSLCVCAHAEGSTENSFKHNLTNTEVMVMRHMTCLATHLGNSFSSLLAPSLNIPWIWYVNTLVWSQNCLSPIFLYTASPFALHNTAEGAFPVELPWCIFLMGTMT